jgi:HAD superfamily hydrolase (TIGR01490 family)
MPLALFDLDNTLLAGDSDHAWGVFLAERGIVDAGEHVRAHDRFLAQYHAGVLDINEFLEFQLRSLARFSRPDLERWRGEYLEAKVRPMMSEAARELVNRHRRRGDRLIVITATNSFITRPIAQEFGVQTLIATEPEEIAGRFTGRVAGVPCFRDGKVTRLEAWLHENGESLAGSWFYSDSHNDLALLERVPHPVAVNPDDRLAAHAQHRGWPVIRF